MPAPRRSRTSTTGSTPSLTRQIGFCATTRYIDAIRQRLSPQTKTDTDELGVILASDEAEIAESKAHPDRIPALYWNAAGALYAYLYAELAKQGIDVIGESQLVGYPSQFPSVTMIDWKNGKPNARYWVLSLLKDNFHPGDQLVATTLSRQERHRGPGFRHSRQARSCCCSTREIG